MGYGDLSPKTTLGRLVVMLMMGSAVVMVPKETNKLVAILASRTVYSRHQYTRNRYTEHIIVCGEIRDGVLEFFQELFHIDRGIDDRVAVIIDIGLP